MRANERLGDWPIDQSEARAQVTGPGYRWLVNSGSGFTVDILTGSKIFFGREGGLLHEALHHIKQSPQMIIGIKRPMRQREKQGV